MQRNTVPAIVILTVFFAACASVSIIYAAVPKTTPTENFTSQPLPNQIIVKYKKDLSPQALQLKVNERKTQQSRYFGSIRLFFDNLKYRLNKQALPEEHLTRIQQADTQVGVQNKTRIFDAADENQRNLFIIQTDGSKSIENMIKIYEALPEVEYAEPNYTAVIQNY